ncbi:hypothetical protein [Millisia brevis]|uniref:hypothetical protein n=1 Tax=Millisia brevis TaxID=264148 RepID=UPI00083753A4|nr:hypothetical protein [Millisia brevis]
MSLARARRPAAVIRVLALAGIVVAGGVAGAPGIAAAQPDIAQPGIARPGSGAVVVGPGTGYVTLGPPGVGTTCSFGAVGMDDAGRLIGVTAGHCIARPGLAVVPAAAPWVAPIGVTGPRSGADFGVIELDPTRVAPTASLGGVTVTALGTAAPGDPVCKIGQGTATTCGIVREVRSNGDPVSDALALWGDSGGPLVRGTDLLGIVSRPASAPGGPTIYTAVLPNLADLAPGDPGHGFVPVS